ncbi:MAG: TIGR02444 family protein [Alphaproteobacteria bacterium]|nr:TIGR02444 family protein [Alphaproteobacteria bacterium]
MPSLPLAGFPESPVWSYSVDLYGRPGVSAACLSLQDRRGLDVNLLLYCCWLAAEGHGALSTDALRGTAEASQPWQRNVVAGLRAIRRQLKGGLQPVPRTLVAAVRDRLSALEIDCEQVEQFVLSDLAPEAPENPVPEEDRATMAAANLRAYCTLDGARLNTDDIEDLISVLSGAFPEADRSALTRWFESGGA